MKYQSRALFIAGFIFLAAVFGARAHPYASGIVNSSGTIYWILNEPATDVKIIFDNGTATNDLGSSPQVGTNSFALGAHHSFSIVVYKIGSNTISQISDDENINNNFYAPRGVAVNRNSKTGNFGRVYVANASGSTANFRPATTQGIYVMDAASDDVLGLGNTAATGGMTFGTGGTYGPFKLFVGTDDSLYIGDAGSGKINGVWVADPNVVTGTALFNSANVSGSTHTNFGRVIGTPNVTGSLAAGNLVLTASMWDTVTGASSDGYNQIYKYNIGSGPLPWKNSPALIYNPIAIGGVNTVLIDAEIAPDGKYFVSAYRSSASDGLTNMCVLNSAGTAVLWDSKTQSASYFGDTTYDHLSISDHSIAVSPDDKYVLIQGAYNNNFMLMALTNGVPDISTLTTNLTVGDSGGQTCYSSTWDAADNIYVTSGGSETLRVFSLGLTSTCVTGNDSTGTNGSFQLTLLSSATPVITAQPTNQTVPCGGSVTVSVSAQGPSLKYQWKFGTSLIAGATNSILPLNYVSVASSGNYQVVISNSTGSVTSQAAALTVLDTNVPVIMVNGGAVTNILLGTTYVDVGASASDACAGSLAVNTSGSVNNNAVGSYTLTYVATNPSGISATNSRIVNVIITSGAPVIAQQPVSQKSQCGSPVTFTVAASGATPFSYQWYFGSTPLTDGQGISGSATANLVINSPALTLSGAYHVFVSNSQGNATSQNATLTVVDTTSPVVTLNGSSVIDVMQGSTFADPGATASDTCSGSATVTSSGSVNTSVVGTYTITYTARDASGNTGTAARTVQVDPANGAVAAAAPSIIPLPQTMQTRPGVFTLCPTQPYPPIAGHALMKIVTDAASLTNAQYLATTLFRSTGYEFQIVTNNLPASTRNTIWLAATNSALAAEGYQLSVAPDSVLITGSTSAGVFYGIESLLQLLPPQAMAQQPVSGVAWVAPCVLVQDQPRFGWRGLELDVARHFVNKEEVKHILDAMALFKLNTFSWHLVDDQAWRIEIKAYPLLTQVGAFRASMDYGLNPNSSTAYNTNGQYGGYYTQDDIRDVVAYAAQRHITVVPELEMPAHCTSALASYPSLGCGNPVSSYNMDSINYGVDLYSLAAPGTLPFVDEVLTEVMQLFPSYYIGCGGDEVVATGDTQWESYAPDVAKMQQLGITGGGSSAIQQYQHYFSTNIAQFLVNNGRRSAGYTETEAAGIVPNQLLLDWEAGSSSQAVAAAEAGQNVVMMPDSNLYLNYYETTNLGIEPYFIVGGEPSYSSINNVYSFEPLPSGLPAQYDGNILGAQSALFCEYVPSLLNVEYKLFPRLCALAEVTWTPAASKNFTSFTQRLVTQEQRLAALGINYNHEGLTQIGSWSSANISTAPGNLTWNISPNLTAPGPVNVNFTFSSGANGLVIYSVALLENGVQVDVDSHVGLAATYYRNDSPISLPVFALHLNSYKPGATYTVQASVAGNGGTSSAGVVYLSNWN
jgi:hexosaminidase